MHKVDQRFRASVLVDESECGLRVFLGIDISKRDFHAALLVGETSLVKSFPNNAKGFRQLATWMRKSRAVGVHACMEAIGTYWEEVAAFLHGEKHDVSVTNPSQIKAFAASELLRVKTDSVDAALIARFCRANRPGLWAPPEPGVRELVRVCVDGYFLRNGLVQPRLKDVVSEIASRDSCAADCLSRVMQSTLEILGNDGSLVRNMVKSLVGVEDRTVALWSESVVREIEASARPTQRVPRKAAPQKNAKHLERAAEAYARSRVIKREFDL